MSSQAAVHSIDALKDFHDGRFRVHFVTNVDGSDVQHTLRGLDPARTAAVLVSKSFGTQETLLNGRVIRDWLGGGERLYAVSANGAACTGMRTCVAAVSAVVRSRPKLGGVSMIIKS